MDLIGPPLTAVMRRLADTPGDFLSEPQIGGLGAVAVDALLSDVLFALGKPAAPEVVAAFGPSKSASRRNLFKLGMIAAWLLADDWLVASPPACLRLDDFLLTALPELAAQSPAGAYVAESDRREELARTLLARLGLRPEGETIEQATDRLTMISAAERSRLLEASRAAEARAREVRAALVRKAAQESADKWTRE